MSKTGKDSLLGNKIAAGLLTAGLIFWGANRIADIVVPDDVPETPAIKVADLQPATAPAAAVPSGPASIIALVATADVAKGTAFVQQQCAACHTMNQGGASGVGPNLYGVLGSPMFSAAGFTFTSAAKSKAKGSWNYDNMNLWLASPNNFAPGTAMSYSGINNTQTRADVVAYLRTLSASPLPLPTPAEVTAASAPAAAAGWWRRAGCRAGSSQHRHDVCFRRSGQGPGGGAAAMLSLPYAGQRRCGGHGAEPVWHCRRENVRPGRVQLFRRGEIQGRGHLDAG